MHRHARRSLSLTIALINNLQFLSQLNHALVGEDTAKVYAGINHAIAADNRTGIDHCVAPDLRSIANDCAEFSEACRNVAIGCYDRDFGVIQLYIGENHARAQMRVMSNDRITHVIEVRHLHVIEQDGILEFARVPHDYAVADDHVLAHVAAAANVAIFADPRWAFQHSALLNDRSSANKNMVADKWFAQQLAQDCRLETKLQVTGNLFERVPDVILVSEQLRMSRVFEIEKIGGRKHE